MGSRCSLAAHPKRSLRFSPLPTLFPLFRNSPSPNPSTPLQSSFASSALVLCFSMGKKKSGSIPKVGSPTQSKQKSKSVRSSSQSQPPPSQHPKAPETAAATVERIFSGAKNKFLAKVQADGAEPTTPPRPSTSIGRTNDATASTPTASTAPVPSTPGLPQHDTRSDTPSESGSADLSDVDQNALPSSGSASDDESETDEEASVAQPPAIAPSFRDKGKQKEERPASTGQVSRDHSQHRLHFP